MRNGTVSRLAPLVPHTAGIASGLWPTPKASNDGDSDCTLTMVDEGKAEASLPRVIRMPYLWPTPQVQDSKHGAPTEWEKANAKQLHLHTAIGGRLSPTFPEWLMGFPIGWTDCDASAMPSCLKSSSCSAMPSSNANES